MTQSPLDFFYEVGSQPANQQRSGCLLQQGFFMSHLVLSCRIKLSSFTTQGLKRCPWQIGQSPEAQSKQWVASTIERVFVTWVNSKRGRNNRGAGDHDVS
jgi:hypothetical protein